MGPKKKSRLDDSGSGGNSNDEEELQEEKEEGHLEYLQEEKGVRLVACSVVAL